MLLFLQPFNSAANLLKWLLAEMILILSNVQNWNWQTFAAVVLDEGKAPTQYTMT